MSDISRGVVISMSWGIFWLERYWCMIRIKSRSASPASVLLLRKSSSSLLLKV